MNVLTAEVSKMQGQPVGDSNLRYLCRVTDHLDDPNRLCVALTRSRQAEVILMHEDMLRQLRANGSFSRGPLAYIVRHCAQADEFVHRPASI